MSGIETLQQWATRIRALPGVMKSDGPGIISDMFGSEMEAAVSAGRAVDGYKWKPRVEDGAKPFANGMAYVTRKVLGAVVLITLQGPMAFAQFGTGKMASRPLLPMGGLPAKLGNAIRKGLVGMGQDWLTRAGRHDKGSGRMHK
jgi:hypothetical protein